MTHDLYLLVAFLTHGIVGYAVVRGITEYPPAIGAVGAVLPDVDLYLGPVLGLPVVHRGAIHTPAALLVLAALVLLASRFASDAPRRVAAAFALGFLTHLVLDSFTNAGIMWLYPASAARVAFGVPIHGAAGTATLLVASLALVRFGPRLRGRTEEETAPRSARRG